MLLYTFFYLACDVGFYPPVCLARLYGEWAAGWVRLKSVAANTVHRCFSCQYASGLVNAMRCRCVGAPCGVWGQLRAGATPQGSGAAVEQSRPCLPPASEPTTEATRDKATAPWKLSVGLFSLFGDNALAIYVIVRGIQVRVWWSPRAV